MTILWRSFIISAAILLHLLSMRMAHAGETMSLDTRGSLASTAGGPAGTPMGIITIDLTPGLSCSSMEQKLPASVRLEDKMAQVAKR